MKHVIATSILLAFLPATGAEPSLLRVTSAPAPVLLAQAKTAEEKKAETTPPPIIIPDGPAPAPPPVPPPPSPNTPQVIGASELYVIRSDLPLIIMTLPEGLVTQTEDSGPVKVRSVFVGGSGKVETKVFVEKHVYFLEAAKSGSGHVIIYPEGAKTRKDVICRLIDCQLAPLPPPTPPEPPPTPVPPAPPDPFMESTGTDPGFRCLIVFDPLKTTRATLPILYGGEFRGYLASKAIKTADGTPEFRMYPPNTDMTNESAVWQKVMKRPRKELPWIVIGNGKTGYEGPLPTAEGEALKLVKKYGE